MKRITAIITALILALSLAACAGQSQEVPASQTTAAEQTEQPSVSEAESDNTTETEEAAQESENETTTEAETEETYPEVTDDRVLTVTDMSGDEVKIEGKVEKIVNLWPAGTSSFFVMGAGEMISALAINNPGTMNRWSQFFYPGANEIPELGGTTPTIEELMNLDPDLVIIHPMTASSGFGQQIRDVGIPAININFSNYDQMIQAYTMLGEILGGTYQARLAKWCSMVEEKQAKIRELTKDITDDERPVVLYISGQGDSLTTTMNATSICADWTDIAGGTYLVSLLDDQSATEVTAETIFSMDPDVILIGGTYQHKLLKDITSLDGWKDLKAVTSGRVYTNPYGCFNWDRFGLESFLQLDYSFMCIQPELAAEHGIDKDYMKNEIIEFYELMNGTTLTEEQAENMLNGLSPDGIMDVDEDGNQN